MKFLYFGIYHCIVHKSLNNDKNKLFRFNKKNYYTNIDLTRAKELGLAIELFDDGKPNLLHYPRNKTINSSQIFKNYVSLLFALKQKGIAKSKQLLNILWGSLSQKNEFSAVVNEDQDDDFVLEDDRSITYLAPLNEKNCFLKYVKNDNYYETNWARLAPFLLAKGRCLISKTIEPFIKNVKRVHTDGFIIDKKVTLKTGNGLGDLKYEGFCPEVYVKNNIRIEGDFKMV